MNKEKPIVISFVGRSNSGKTTLIEKIIYHYSQNSKKIAVIKSTNHSLTPADEKKDTGKFLAKGARASLITDGKYCILESGVEKENIPETLIEDYFKLMDIVFVEGFKQSNLKKIEVIGDSSEMPLYKDGIENIKFIVSDKMEDSSLPLFKRNDVKGIINALEGIF